MKAFPLPPLAGEGRDEGNSAQEGFSLHISALLPVIPAKAGIQISLYLIWIPARASLGRNDTLKVLLNITHQSAFAGGSVWILSSCQVLAAGAWYTFAGFHCASSF